MLVHVYTSSLMALHYSKEKSGQFPEEILIDKLVRITFLKEPCKS